MYQLVVESSSAAGRLYKSPAGETETSTANADIAKKQLVATVEYA
jgi:hypothetical protein